MEIAKKAISLYLLTGMRKSELIGDKARSIPALTWDRVNTEDGTLLVYTKVRKSAKAQLRTIFCSRAVVEILKSIPKIEGNPNVITGRLKNSSFVGIQDIWQRVRKEAGLEPEGKTDNDPPSIHDLRRTYASIVHDLGYKAYASDLLGHKVKNPTDIYTRSEILRLMKVAELAGKRINGLLCGTVKPLGYKMSENNSPKSKNATHSKQKAKQS
jgi:integrase